MNKKLQEFARKELKRGLSVCTDAQQLAFKRMYFHPTSPTARRRISDLANAIMTTNINVIVDYMDAEKLSHAMNQVQATIEKNKTNEVA